jgi:hypothetical protein
MPVLELNRHEVKLLQEAVQKFMDQHRSPDVWLPGQQTLAALNVRAKGPTSIKALLPPQAVALIRAALAGNDAEEAGRIVAKLPQK